MKTSDHNRMVRGKRKWAIGLVLRMGVGMTIFVFGGLALDRVLRTTPLFLLTGTILGAFLVFMDIVRSGQQNF